MKRAALVAGVSIATLLGAGPTEVLAWNGNPGSFWGSPRVADPTPQKSVKHPASERKSTKAADQGPPPPRGVLHIIVSIDKQRATLFADGLPFASTAISSGTSGHPTPMGLFTVIQKDRHHVSNLYDASMPYMQRITWSGAALHEGPLPGYPASHGCVRLTNSFAQLLWKTTKMGARIIITNPEVAPLEIEHARLFVPRPKMVEAPRTAPSITVAEAKSVSQALAVSQPAAPTPVTTGSVVKTADAANAVAVMAVVDGGSVAVASAVVTEPSPSRSAEQSTKLSVPDGTADTIVPADIAAVKAKPVETVEIKPVAARAVEAIPAAATPVVIDERPKTMPATIVQEANRRPISVFVSLKEGKLYVRQGWKPLFQTPVSFEQPDQPIGTHVYTAMGAKADGSGLRWTVVSIPSSTKRVETKVWNEKKSRDHIRTTEVAAPIPSASAALDRVIMPPEAVERISELMMPGSSLIVSDNKLSDETGEYTDFIVLTR